jgi:hypothetical protein
MVVTAVQCSRGIQPNADIQPGTVGGEINTCMSVRAARGGSAAYCSHALHVEVLFPCHKA